jgi:hypothetical protein
MSFVRISPPVALFIRTSNKKINRNKWSNVMPHLNGVGATLVALISMVNDQLSFLKDLMAKIAN